MITFCNMTELEATKEALSGLNKDYQNLYQKLVESVYLTRALHFKYHYMGSLITDEDPGQYTPYFVHDSVVRLYLTEIQSLKQDENFHLLQQIFIKFKNIGYANISLLVLGMKPESLVGASNLK